MLSLAVVVKTESLSSERQGQLDVSAGDQEQSGDNGGEGDRWAEGHRKDGATRTGRLFQLKDRAGTAGTDADIDSAINNGIKVLAENVVRGVIKQESYYEMIEGCNGTE